MKTRKGFTLVELLVVIAVIALLMAILMPVLRRAQDQAMRILCGNHEKNLLLAFTMYADTHNNRIPSGGGYWPWDVAMSTRNTLLRNMGVDVDAFTKDVQPRNPGDTTFTAPSMGGGYGSSSGGVPIQYADNFYCPANKAHLRYKEQYWSYSSYIVAGFGFLWHASWNGNGKTPVYAAMKPEDIPALTDPTKMYVDRIDMPQSSERELIVDATISSFTGNDRTLYPFGNFIKVNEGAWNTDSSSHFITDSKAAGGNMGFLDGHVEWRSWSDMKIRWSGRPAWWW